ncbi:MAG: SRPBCC family protein [Chloroflexi bacterium]|nr:SRPBCC family protein [Chloroflexota bacterium]
MHLEDEFTIATLPDRAYELLLDLRRVAPCVPGAAIGEPDAEGFHPGRVVVKVGPMRFIYDGRVRIAEQDPVARTAVIVGEGRASGGSDTAKVRTTMQVLPAGSGSRVRMTTDLEIKGRAAQMGQGVIADVGRRLVKDAAVCIEIRLAAPDGADPDDLPTVDPVSGLSLVASVMTSKVGASVRRLVGHRSDDTEPSMKGTDDGTR